MPNSLKTTAKENPCAPERWILGSMTLASYQNIHVHHDLHNTSDRLQIDPYQNHLCSSSPAKDIRETSNDRASKFDDDRKEGESLTKASHAIASNAVLNWLCT
mmetsp:Transcript_12964/g.30723  ORF Transcript_12964/g.30723 Transcript_12964/m.30723 type:complete len:103 (+) Transcript_12964:154-462(+)